MSESQSVAARQSWKLAKALSPAILDKEENKIWSPSCATHLLAVARRGASGLTLDELNALLGPGDFLSDADPFGLISDREWGLENYEAQSAAALWLSKTASPQQGFLDACEESGVHVSFDDLKDPSVGREISRWISEKTHGLLSPSVTLSPDALVCLVSALYLKDKWVEKFLRTASKVGPFHALSGDEPAAFMNMTDYYRVFSGDDFTVISVPLWSGADILLALPDAAELEYDKGLAVLEHAVRDGADREHVALSIPRFECKATIDDLGGPLEAAGVSTDYGMELLPMIGVEPTPSQVVHGAKLAIDEDGVEAGAYTEMLVCAGMPFDLPKPRKIVFDRPFIVALVSRTGAPLFVGTVAHPSKDTHVWRRLEISDDSNIWDVQEIEGQCRLTAERNEESKSFEITCEIFGSMVHTIPVSSHGEVNEKYETIQRELDGFFRQRGRDGFDESAWIQDFIERW